MPVHHGDVALVHRAAGKRLVELALHRGASRHEHQARGGHVQPVHDEGIGEPALHPGAQAVLFVFTPPGD